MACYLEDDGTLVCPSHHFVRSRVQVLADLDALVEHQGSPNKLALIVRFIELVLDPALEDDEIGDPDCRPSRSADTLDAAGIILRAQADTVFVNDLGLKKFGLPRVASLATVDGAEEWDRFCALRAYLNLCP